MANCGNCVLPSLTDVNLMDATPGLVVTDYELQLSKTNFQCCQGTGMWHQEKGNISGRCDLRRRTATVSSLVSTFSETWGSDFELPKTLPTSDVKGLARRLGGKSFETSKGYSLARAAPMNSPSPLWAIALAASWRFGVDVHVATIGKTPWEKLVRKESGDRLLVIVEGIDQLWNQRRAEELEFVVGWAYQARAQLWCDWILHQPQQNECRRRSTWQKVAGLRSRSPLAWLNADMHSKLDAVTDGLLPIVNWPQSRAKPAKRSVARPEKTL